MASEFPWTSLNLRVRQGYLPENWASLGPPASLSGLLRRRDDLAHPAELQAG